MRDEKIISGLTRRESAILETGRDPKTGLTARLLELTEETRLRGGARSRRRTARVWRSVEPEQPSAD